MAEQATAVPTPYPQISVKSERRAWLRFPSDRDIICKPPIKPPQGERASLFPVPVCYRQTCYNQ